MQIHLRTLTIEEPTGETLSVGIGGGTFFSPRHGGIGMADRGSRGSSS